MRSKLIVVTTCYSFICYEIILWFKYLQIM